MLVRLVLVPVLLATATFGAGAAFLPQVPQAELASFCQEYGAARTHLATFFMDNGVRLRGHVNCKSVTFTINAILPPIA